MRRCCLIAIELKSRSSHGLLKALMSCKAECTNRLSTMAACALLHGACCMNSTRVQLCFKACLTELECCSPVCCCWGAGDVVHLLHVISDPRSSSTPGERAEHSAANHLWMSAQQAAMPTKTLWCVLCPAGHGSKLPMLASSTGDVLCRLTICKHEQRHHSVCSAPMFLAACSGV